MHKSVALVDALTACKAAATHCCAPSLALSGAVIHQRQEQ